MSFPRNRGGKEGEERRGSEEPAGLDWSFFSCPECACSRTQGIPAFRVFFFPAVRFWKITTDRETQDQKKKKKKKIVALLLREGKRRQEINRAKNREKEKFYFSDVLRFKQFLDPGRKKQNAPKRNLQRFAASKRALVLGLR